MTDGHSHAVAGTTYGVGALLVLGAVLGLFLMAGTADPVMGFHGFLFVAFCEGVFQGRDDTCGALFAHKSRPISNWRFCCWSVAPGQGRPARGAR